MNRVASDHDVVLDSLEISQTTINRDLALPQQQQLQWVTFTIKAPTAY